MPYSLLDKDLSHAMAGTTLSIDLDAIAYNYTLLKDKLVGAECAAVVKADAYGLGAKQVAPRLYHEGCRTFFVAHLSEALALKDHIPEDATIIVLHGAMRGAEELLAEKELVPVLNSLEQVRAWSQTAQSIARPLPALLQVDSGMARMGLSQSDLKTLLINRSWLAGLEITHIMSHLACADTPHDPTNRLQLDNFRKAQKAFGTVKGCLTNSSGIFLGPDYHFDLARPGICLYGGRPQADIENPMKAVVRLESKIVNIRTLEAGDGVGYAMSFRAKGKTRLATIAIGYADGFLRYLSNRGQVFYEGTPLPIAGRVSMDSVGIDISSLPEGTLKVGDSLEVLGPHQGIDQLADACDTISYEILTSLGTRYHRVYLGQT